MQRARRCWKLLTDSNRCVLNSRHFTTGTKGASSGSYCAIGHRPTLITGTFASRRRPLPAVLQCSSLKQDSRFRRIRGKVPDEIWAIVIFGVGGLIVFTVTEYRKNRSGKKRPPELQFKLKMAKKKSLNGDKVQAIILLKEALGLIHDYLEEIKKYSSEELNEQEGMDKIKIQKYLTYVLVELANQSFELQKWNEAEHYFRLLLRDLLSSETPKDDDSVVEVSLKLSISCAHQDKHDLAIQGFQWATDTIQKKVDQIPYASDNRSKTLADVLTFSGTGLTRK